MLDDVQTQGDRLRALREALGWSQEQVARESAGKIDRPRVGRMESGVLKFNSVKARESLSIAFGVTRRDLDAYLSGAMELSDLIARMRQTERLGSTPPEASPGSNRMGILGTSSASGTRYPRLELALSFYAESGRRWGDDVVAAARAGHFGPDDFTPMDWQAKLDYLESVMSKARRDQSAHYRKARQVE